MPLLNFERILPWDLFLILVIVVSTIFLITHRLEKKQALLFYSLYLYHLVFTCVYYKAGAIEVSDAANYYKWSFEQKSWLSALSIARNFVTFFVYPFSQYLQASFITVMVFFSTLGFLGIYWSSRHLVLKHGLRYGLIALLFIPGLHYWTSNVGKEALVLFSLGIVINQLIKPRPNLLLVVLGVGIGLLVRPYVGVMLAFSLSAAYVFFANNISLKRKLLVGFACAVLTVVALGVFTSTLNVTSIGRAQEEIVHRQANWTAAGSTLNLTQYNAIERVFVFLYRPFFFDARKFSMLLSSVENLVLLFFSVLLIFDFFKAKRLKDLSGLARFSLIYLAFSVLVYSSVTANLGTAVRKKSTIIPLFIILFAHYGYTRREQLLTRCIDELKSTDAHENPARLRN